MRKKLFTGILLLIFLHLLTSLLPCHSSEIKGTHPISSPQNSSTGDIYAEGVRTLQEYLRIDTTNPPGNEMRTAQFLKKIADREGIENRIFDMGNNRANFCAVIKGDGSKKGIIMLHHMDVVPAEAQYWKVSPFSGEIVNGEIYGRGAMDIKGKGIIDLMTLINIKRKNVKLKGDLVFLAVADEEVNSTGSKWMIENQPELVKSARFLIDEGESISVDENGKNPRYYVSIGEKAPLWIKFTFKGEPGHGSIPDENSSVNRAIRAAKRILDYEMEFTVLPDITEDIRESLKDRDITKIPGYKGSLEESLKNRAFLLEISKDADINALLRTTISITRLKGSDKTNTIPNEASFSVDCRLIPGTDRDEFIEKLKKIINDETVTYEIEEFMPATKSPSDSDFVKAIRTCAAKRDPGAKVVPTILTSSTDSSLYRPSGILAYGFEPYKITDEEGNLSHNNDERLSVENVKFGIDLMTDIIMELNR